VNAFSGRVTSAELNQPLPDVTIKRVHPDGSLTGIIVTNENGHYQLPVTNQNETLRFEKSGYIRKSFKADCLPHTVRLLESAIIGYQEKLWFKSGENIRALVHSPTSYSATLFRHGMAKEVILKLGKKPPVQQSVPDDYFVESGLDWHTAFTYKIPRKAQPGLYSLLLEPEEGKKFAIPFIVSTSESDYGQKSKLLVLAGTNTWQSYNLWGGRNRYRNFETAESGQYMAYSRSWISHLYRKTAQMIPYSIRQILRRIAGQSQPEWKFQKLTIRRPFTNCGLDEETVDQSFTNHLGGGEWRLLAWLERENIAYDIVSGFELDRSPDLLSRYKGIILSTHCEYWSQKMYFALKKSHQNHGLWILNLSGNSLYREIEFFDDGSTRCTSLFFHRSCEDETRLLGVRFTEDDYGTCAPFKIIRPVHWIFQNLPHHKGQLFGTESLNRKIPGTEEIYDSGSSGWAHQDGKWIN